MLTWAVPAAIALAALAGRRSPVDGESSSGDASSGSSSRTGTTRRDLSGLDRADGFGPARADASAGGALVRDVRRWTLDGGAPVVSTVEVRAWDEAASEAAQAAPSATWTDDPLPWSSPMALQLLPVLFADGGENPDFGHLPQGSGSARRNDWSAGSEYVAQGMYLQERKSKAPKVDTVPTSTFRALFESAHVWQAVVGYVNTGRPKVGGELARLAMGNGALTFTKAIDLPGVVCLVDMGHRPVLLSPASVDYWRAKCGVLSLFGGVRGDGYRWWGGDQRDPLMRGYAPNPSVQTHADVRPFRDGTEPMGWPDGVQAAGWWAAILQDGTVVPYVTWASPVTVFDDVQRRGVGVYGAGRMQAFGRALPFLLVVVQFVLNVLGAGAAGSLVASVTRAVAPAVKLATASLDKLAARYGA